MEGDLETRELDAHTLLGGWRMLCVGALHQCVRRLAMESFVPRTQAGVYTARQRRLQEETAEEWLEGGVGVLTFEECCEVIGVRPAQARERIKAYVRANRRRLFDEQRKQERAAGREAEPVRGLWPAGVNHD